MEAGDAQAQAQASTDASRIVHVQTQLVSALKQQVLAE